MTRVVTIIGARPQFVKASVVSSEFRRVGGVEEVVVHTGQHYDANMSDVFFTELDMAPPSHHLGVGGGTHGEMTGRMLMAIERVLLSERPDVLLVYGDTNSTLAGALAAAKLHVPVAHVEAGLRSFNLRMPEEVNRILTDRISRWLFAPTDTAMAHLRREGTAEEQLLQVGDVMYDVAKAHGARIGAEGRSLERLGLIPHGYVLATVHRAENADDPTRLGAIVAALEALASDLPVVWPVHPRTRSVIAGLVSAERTPRLLLVEPVGYLDMVQLEKYAALIVTDSGGVQKEAYFHGVPCVTVRDETEWVELVDAGWNRLAPPTSATSVESVARAAIGTVGRPVALYGTGDASERIVARLLKDLG